MFDFLEQRELDERHKVQLHHSLSFGLHASKTSSRSLAPSHLLVENIRAVHT